MKERPPLATSHLGMVTSPHTLATEAGLRVLREGGNAIEASVAMASSIAVTYPHFAGIGGDSIWIVADRDGRKMSVLGIGHAADKLPAYDGGIPVRGAGSTLTSAGTVDAWGEALKFSSDHWQGTKSLSALQKLGRLRGLPGVPRPHPYQHPQARQRGLWRESRDRALGRQAQEPGHEQRCCRNRADPPALGDRCQPAPRAGGTKPAHRPAQPQGPGHRSGSHHPPGAARYRPGARRHCQPAGRHQPQGRG